MSELFCLSGALRRHPAVEAWFAEPDQSLRRIARVWFECMRACGDDVRELMHDGCPTACLGDAAFAYVGAYRSHVNIGFFYGAMLHDPAGLFVGAGKRMRHVKLRADQAFDVEALPGLVRAAYEDIRKRVAEPWSH